MAISIFNENIKIYEIIRNQEQAKKLKPFFSLLTLGLGSVFYWILSY